MAPFFLTFPAAVDDLVTSLGGLSRCSSGNFLSLVIGDGGIRSVARVQVVELVGVLVSRRFPNEGVRDCFQRCIR